jgi:hypothetical protein
MPWRTLTLSLAMAALAAGCGDDQRRGGPASTGSSKPGEELSRVGRLTRPRRCPATQNNTRIPPPHERPQLPETGNVYYTNGRLWTILGEHGVIRSAPRSDGSIREKFPWWRGGRGALRITGRRLDQASAALRAHIPAGYGSVGFQATAITFPTAGCWEVTASAGGTSLTFVTLVVEV